jgi:hypothetical protein
MEFNYEESTFPGPTIINVDCAESLKIIIIRTIVNFRSLTLSTQAAVDQENNENNTSEKNKYHERKNT